MDKQIHLIIGSQMGNAEYVAEQLAEALSTHQYTTELHFQPDYAALPAKNSTWLICTSTYGAGDYPDNLVDFTDALKNANELNTICYGIIGIGDRSYDTFNLAAIKLDQLLEQKKAIRIGTRLEIDVLSPELPEDQALQWLPAWIDALKARD